MSDLVKRLRASVKMDAHNGDAVERSICGKQMLEASDRLNALEQDIADYKEGAAGMRMSISDLRRERDELDQIVTNLRRKLAEAYTEASNVAGRAIAEWAARGTMGIEQEPLATRVVHTIRALITKEAKT